MVNACFRDFDYVETHGAVNLAVGVIKADAVFIALSALAVHRLVGRAVIIVRTRFNLDKSRNLALIRA